MIEMSINPVREKNDLKPRAEIFRPRISNLPKLTFLRQLFRWILKLLARISVLLVLKVEINGEDNFPLNGKGLVVFNHLGDTDAILAFAKTPRYLEFMAKSEFYDLPFIGSIIRAYGVIWVHRGRPDRNALRAALLGLDQGRLISLAPEGRESLTGKLEEGTHGAAYLALKSASPIIPITFTGTENKYVYGNLRHLKRTKVSMTIGQPFTLEESSNRRETLHAGTQKIMETLAGQLPSEYRGVFLERVD